MEMPDCKAFNWVQDAGLDGCGGDLLLPPEHRKLLDINAGMGIDVTSLRQLQAPIDAAAISPCCNVLQADADGHSCGHRIMSLVNNTGVTISLARAEVSAAYPKVCGPCGQGGASRCWLWGSAPTKKVHIDGVVSGLPAARKPQGDASLMTKAVTAAYGGTGLDYAKLCPPSNVQILSTSS